MRDGEEAMSYYHIILFILIFSRNHQKEHDKIWDDIWNNPRLLALDRLLDTAGCARLAVRQ